MNKVIKYVVYDIVRNRFVLSYTLLLLLISLAFFGFEADPNKGLLSLLNIILMVVPLVSIIFSTIHFYNSYEFLELLSAQPISRKTIFFSQYMGVCIALCLAFMIGIGIPVYIFEGSASGLTLVFCGLLLTLAFISLAFLASAITKDKAKGIGISLGIWFYFSIVYDGLVLTALLSFSDYPLEKASLFFTALNPTDLARILVLMKLDISALLGVTGAIFQQFFSSYVGFIIAIVLLFFWILGPVLIASRIFYKKDL
ncbi:ABC transporter permease subunit [Emticicia sp. TH156]|uniref:ABC transporter permease subunit n=1 Tax=Emticicia sp. TH156 TaxID=2067454 RepID=UPI000C769CA6|nr:ABC transporter permease subunit [Emticicia sp. TH156]PLK42168.1 ABC transporter permease [Emticicia sp. TH156]